MVFLLGFLSFFGCGVFRLWGWGVVRLLGFGVVEFFGCEVVGLLGCWVVRLWSFWVVFGSAGGQLLGYGSGAVVVVVVVFLEYIREKEQFEDKKENSNLYEYDCPQFLANGHAPESVDIKIYYRLYLIADLHDQMLFKLLSKDNKLSRHMQIFWGLWGFGVVRLFGCGVVRLLVVRFCGCLVVELWVLGCEVYYMIFVMTLTV